MTRTDGKGIRSGSTPPSRSARVAAEQSAADASTARVAAEQAEESAAILASLLAASQDPELRKEGLRRGRVYSQTTLAFPPVENVRKGHRYFYSDGHPLLEDGIYTCLSLRRCGVDPEIAHSCIESWRGEEGVFRRCFKQAYQIDYLHLW